MPDEKKNGVNGGGDIKVTAATEKMRVRYGFALAVTGISLAVLLAILLPLSPWGLKTASDVVAVISVLTGLLGTLVGFFFGVNVAGSQADAQKERAVQAEEQADKATRQAETANSTAKKAMALLPQQSLDELKNAFPEMFTTAEGSS